MTNWLPTEENLAVLPAGVKEYIHALETNADPAGTVRQNVLLREQLEYLGALVEELQKDAERLDYAEAPSGALRIDRRETFMAVPLYVYWGHLAGPNAPKSLREALDAAIAARGSEASDA